MKLPENPQIPDLITTLTFSISTVQFSRTRWSSVQSTVHRLSSSLSSLSLSSATSPLLYSLLSSLTTTLSFALHLSSLSQNPNPTNKLFLNSDILSTASALSSSADNLDLAVSSQGLLVGSGVKNVLARLQIGSPAVKLESLDNLIKESDTNLELGIDSKAITAIVRLFDIQDLKEKAVELISRISCIDKCSEALCCEKDSILKVLVRFLDCESGYPKESACIALSNLTSTKDNAVLVSSRGGIGCLLHICRSGTPNSVASAASVLRNLSFFPEIRKKFIEHDAISSLVEVLKCGNLNAQENCMGCLCNLGQGMDDESLNLKLDIFKHGVLDCMTEYIDSDRNLQPAIGLLHNLAYVKYVSDIIQTSDLYVKLLLALDSSSSITRILAAKCICDIEFNGKYAKEICDAIPKLVKMFDSKVSQEKNAAVKALCYVVKFSPRMKRVFKKEEKGVVNSVVLLDPLVKGVDKKCVIEVLSLVSQSRKCRRLMMACGASEFLKKLVAMEVDGAKKLLECLEKGKIWGVFPRN